MGIRYYAYAFDGDQTESALAEPRSFIGADPLADAFGLPPGFTEGYTDFEQGPPEAEMLYLDKVWNNLQRMTKPSRPDGQARPAYRMFEGAVTPVDSGWAEWRPWLRVIAPDEVKDIADDLDTLTDADFIPFYSVHGDATDEDRASERAGVAQFVSRAISFLRGLERTERGFVYMIG